MLYGDLIGIKYKPHGRTKEDGFDCYGLVLEVLRRNDIDFPDLYYDSLKVPKEFVDLFDTKTEKISKPEINCLVEIMSYGQPGHLAVYIGEGLMIHTLISTNVCIEPISRYKAKIRGFYRVKN